MVDRDIIEKFKRIVGVKTKIYERIIPSHKTQYGISISISIDILQIILMFMPYVGSRRKAKFMEFIEWGGLDDHTI